MKAILCLVSLVFAMGLISTISAEYQYVDQIDTISNNIQIDKNNLYFVQGSNVTVFYLDGNFARNFTIPQNDTDTSFDIFDIESSMDKIFLASNQGISAYGLDGNYSHAFTNPDNSTISASFLTIYENNIIISSENTLKTFYLNGTMINDTMMELGSSTSTSTDAIFTLVNKRIFVYHFNGSQVRDFSVGDSDDEIFNPSQIASSGDTLFVLGDSISLINGTRSDTSDGIIKIYDTSGNYQSQFNSSIFNDNQTGIINSVFASSDNIFLFDDILNRVQIFCISCPNGSSDIIPATNATDIDTRNIALNTTQISVNATSVNVTSTNITSTNTTETIPSTNPTRISTNATDTTSEDTTSEDTTDDIPTNDTSDTTTIIPDTNTAATENTTDTQTSADDTLDEIIEQPRTIILPSTKDITPPQETKQTEMISSDPKTRIPGFPDPSIDPQIYLDRYSHESAFKDWFDLAFPEYTISQIVGTPKPTIQNDTPDTDATDLGPTCGAGTTEVNEICISDIALDEPTCGAGTIEVNNICISDGVESSFVDWILYNLGLD